MPNPADLLHFLQSSTDVGLCWVDAATGTLHCEPKARQWLAPDATAPLSWAWLLDHLDPSARDQLARAAEATWAGRGEPFDLQVHVGGAAAVPRPLRLSGCPQNDATGRAEALLLAVRPLPSATEPAPELRAAEAWQLLDLSAAQVGFGFGYRDRGFAAGHWSSQLKMMFGLPATAPTPSLHETLQCVVPESRERVAERLRAGAAVGEVVEYQYDILRVSDGVRRTLLTRAVWLADPTGQPWRIAFATADLTDQLARERQMNEAQQRLQLAIQALGIGTWERDVDAERGRWDATTLALFGLPPGALAPTNDEYLGLVHPADRDWMNERFHPHRTTREEHLDFTFRVLRPDGDVRWLHILGRGESDASGRVVRRVGICMDVTARRSAEEAMRAKELAERANQAKTQFLSRMSHELRTPLNAVLGFAQVMALDTRAPLPAAHQPRVKHIQDAGWHLLHLIDDVLDIASIESGEASLQMAWVPLADVLRELLPLHSADAARAGVTLRFEATALVLWCDRRRLKQLLLNLVSNAIKYNRAGGRVDVGAARLGADDRLWVRDTGLGIETAKLAELFQPFNRLGRERTGIPGNGIGLSLCRQIAEQMQGRLEVQSEPGVGSEFRLVLPHPADGEAPPGGLNR